MGSINRETYVSNRWSYSTSGPVSFTSLLGGTVTIASMHNAGSNLVEFGNLAVGTTSNTALGTCTLEVRRLTSGTPTGGTVLGAVKHDTASPAAGLVVRTSPSGGVSSPAADSIYTEGLLLGIIQPQTISGVSILRDPVSVPNTPLAQPIKLHPGEALVMRWTGSVISVTALALSFQWQESLRG